MFILRPICLLSSDSSCSICCSSCGVSVHRNMSSAKRRLERNSPSIFTPLFSQFNLLNILSNVAVNSLSEMVSPCLTPLLILIFSLSLFVLSLTNIRIIKFVNLYKIDHLIETITSSITIIMEVYAHQICKTPLFVKVLLAQSYEAHPFTKALLAQSYERRLLQRHYSRRVTRRTFSRRRYSRAQTRYSIAQTRHSIAQTRHSIAPFHVTGAGSILHRADSTLHRADSTLHRADSTLHRADSTLHRADSTLYRADSTLHRADSTLHRADSVLHRADSTLHRADSNHFAISIYYRPLRRLIRVVHGGDALTE